jgi:hypothetical protein
MSKRLLPLLASALLLFASTVRADEPRTIDDLAIGESAYFQGAMLGSHPESKQICLSESAEVQTVDQLILNPSEYIIVKRTPDGEFLLYWELYKYSHREESNGEYFVALPVRQNCRPLISISE